MLTLKEEDWNENSPRITWQISTTLILRQKSERENKTIHPLTPQQHAIICNTSNAFPPYSQSSAKYVFKELGGDLFSPQWYIGKEGMKIVAQFLHQHPNQIKSIDLSWQNSPYTWKQNRYWSGIEHLYNALKTNKSVRELILGEICVYHFGETNNQDDETFEEFGGHDLFFLLLTSL